MARKHPLTVENSGITGQKNVSSPLKYSIEEVLLGPTVLALTIGVQLTIWLWRTFWRRTITKEQLEPYTSLVYPMFQPENDKPIYIAGAALSLIMATVVYFLWRRRWKDAGSNQAGGAPSAPVLVYFFAAIVAVTFVPMLWIHAGWLSLAAAILGIVFLAILWKVPDGGGFTPSDVSPRPTIWKYGAGLWTALAVVFLCLYISDVELLSGVNYQLDNYTHWNGYAMFPALAYRNGGALITEHYVQYGVGWPLVLAGLSHFVPLSYKLGLQLAVIWGCFYYAVLFCFLQTLLRKTSWALAGLIFTLFLQCFGGMVGTHRWWLPSGTVLRYSVDMLFFLVCLLHARSGKFWWGFIVGALLGCALLFATDTGLYLLVCCLFYVPAVWWLQSPRVGLRTQLLFAASAASTFLLTAIIGFATATRGTMFHGKFWSQWLEAIIEYGSGISDLPIERTMSDWCTYLILAAMLVVYLLAVFQMLEGLLFRRLTAEGLITGIVALYGMASLLLFVGRSDPPYLRNVAVPFCVLVIWYAFRSYEFIVPRLTSFVLSQQQAAIQSMLAWTPWLVVAISLVALCASPGFLDYPGMLQTSLGNSWTNYRTNQRLPEDIYPPDNYLFASRRDASLPEKRRGEVQAFQEVTKAMKELSDRRHSVAMLDMKDTEYLVEADIRPYFRYSPVLQTLLTKEQVRGVESNLIENPPDYVFYPAESPPTLFGRTADDIYPDIRQVIREHFDWDRTVGGMDIYRRKGLPGP